MKTINTLFIHVERLLHPRIKEVIAKSLVYYFSLKECHEYHKTRYLGHPHLLDSFDRLVNAAHRGFSGVYPENTLLAFEMALTQGADMIELDVQLSADGQIVVCHDPMLKRLTGQAVYIRDLPAQKLSEFDVGAWMSNDYRGQQIPTLSEVFALIPPETLINIEIKHEASSFFHWQTEKAVLALIKTHRREKQVIIAAFNPMIVNRIRKLAPEISTAYLITQTLNPLLIFLLARIRARYLHVDMRYLSPKIVQALQAKGLQVLGYTLNSVAEYQQASRMGLKGIITDYPDRLQAFLTQTHKDH
ncbi:MAG: glycerophosphodiester phosphodiesterase [Candidatus Sericytochromatia bacterium]